MLECQKRELQTNEQNSIALFRLTNVCYFHKYENDKQKALSYFMIYYTLLSYYKKENQLINKVPFYLTPLQGRYKF
jgi:hypothetical protein